MIARVAITMALIIGLAMAGILAYRFLVPDPPPITLIAVGDTSGYRMLEEIPHDSDPLASVRPVIGEPDLFVFNYEGVILEAEPGPGACPGFSAQSTFYTTTSIADDLRAGQINIATLANNHILDCGFDGVVSTIARFEAAGIRVVGAGPDLASACRPLPLTDHGRNLALLAYLAIPDSSMCAAADKAGAACLDPCQGSRRIGELKSAGYSVIVALHMHMGPSWTEQVHDAHVALVDEVLAAGADVVLGHGAHVPQAVMERDGRLALFGLGNFLFNTDYVMPLEAHNSVVASLELGPEHTALSLLPVMLERNGMPYPAPAYDGSAIVHRIAWLSEAFDTRVRVHEGENKTRAMLAVRR